MIASGFSPRFPVEASRQAPKERRKEFPGLRAPCCQTKSSGAPIIHSRLWIGKRQRAAAVQGGKSSHFIFTDTFPTMASSVS